MLFCSLTPPTVYDINRRVVVYVFNGLMFNRFTPAGWPTDQAQQHSAGAVSHGRRAQWAVYRRRSPYQCRQGIRHGRRLQVRHQTASWEGTDGQHCQSIQVNAIAQLEVMMCSHCPTPIKNGFNFNMDSCLHWPTQTQIQTPTQMQIGSNSNPLVQS